MNRKQRSMDGKAKAPPGDAHRRYQAVLDSGDEIEIHGLGVLAHQQGRNDIAVEAISRAIALNGAIASFHYNLALALKALDRLEEAAASYRRALALKPDHAEAHNNLGNVLAALGRGREARESFNQALALRPDFVQAHYSLANLLCDLGQPDAATPHLQACLTHDPQDSLGVTLLLARLGDGPVPAQATAAQLESIYGKRALTWDRGEQYRGHRLVAEALRKFAAASALVVLDAGCGTGLVGPLIRDLAQQLEGVDISAAMLERAAEKQVYDQLYRDDMIGFMARGENRHDAIVSAATLIHFGDLAPVFAAAGAALKNDGLFVFTLFPDETASQDFAVAQDFELAKGGCYMHSRSYVIRQAAAAGFGVEMLATEIHEQDRGGAPVPALIVVLRRIAR